MWFSLWGDAVFQHSGTLLMILSRVNISGLRVEHTDRLVVLFPVDFLMSQLSAFSGSWVGLKSWDFWIPFFISKQTFVGDSTHLVMFPSSAEHHSIPEQLPHPESIRDSSQRLMADYSLSDGSCLLWEFRKLMAEFDSQLCVTYLTNVSRRIPDVRCSLRGRWVFYIADLFYSYV